MKIAILSSGKSRGSNFTAIVNAIQRENLHFEIGLVHCTRKSSGVFEIAKRNQINVQVFAPKRKLRNDYFQRLISVIQENNIELIVLAGFMLKIPEFFIQTFQDQIINIHPALLPAFGGAGFFGMNVHQEVWKKGVKYSGITIHFVNEKFDDGMIIHQQCVPINFDDSVKDIAQKVLKLEHKNYWKIIELISQKKILIKNNRVRILENNLGI